MISIQNLGIEFNSTALFENANFVINKKDKIALVGKNGAGKSTMLKIIAGLQEPTYGTVALPKGLAIGYLPQQMVLTDGRSVVEEVRTVFGKIDKMKANLDALNEELSERTDYDSDGYQELIGRIANLTDLILMEESESSEAELEKTLLGLGFLRSDFGRDTSEFSGGWRMRIELAKLLLQRPDVLLLDEPTNHLDIESIQWLENFLKLKSNVVVLVSHDCAFIDNVTNRTLEISCGKVYDYQVNYSKYVELHEERIEQQRRAYENQQKQIQQTEQFIERFRYKATKAVQVQSRIKQLSKIEEIEVDEIDNSRLSLKFPPAPRSGDYPVICDGVSKTYGHHLVFSDVDLTLKRGEKVAFVGKNGEGKSTLVKCIMGEIPFDGSLKIGHNVKIGYFAQNQASLLDGEITVFDTIDYVATGDIRTKIRDILGAFMFGGEASDKKVKVLSGGEKTRLAMIRLLLEPVNLLILDEPTNHLDMRTKDILKQAIKDFEGTVIVVSHDRDFLDGLVDKVYEFGGGQVKEFLGGIYDFLQTKQLASLQELEKNAAANLLRQNGVDASQAIPSVGKMLYAEKKEQEKQLRKAERRVAKAESAVAELEDMLSSVEQELASGINDNSLFERHGTLRKELEAAMEEWESATSELEDLTTNLKQN